MASVQFWFDFASTYSYVAALRVEERARAAGAALEWKPFLLGPIFRRQGWDDSPYNLNPARGRYMWHDVERQCRRYGFPFRRPAQFPRNPLLAARVALVAAGRPWLPDFIRAAFRANFADDRDIADQAVIRDVLRSLGQEAQGVLALAQDSGNKERLRLQTEAAWELGICGAPTFVVGDELFWGNDRFEEALDWAGRVARA